MAKGDISLHPKYGLNPTIPKCFICGKERNELVFLGRNYKEEAPMNMVVDFIPCDECKETKLKGNVCLIEMVEERDEIYFNKKKEYKKHPTGAFIVLKGEAFRRMFQLKEEDATPNIAYLENSVFQQLLKMTKEAGRC